MVFMGQQRSGIQEIVFRQVVLHPENAVSPSLPGKERSMVHARCPTVIFSGADMVMFYNIRFYMPGDREDLVSGFCALVDDGL